MGMSRPSVNAKMSLGEPGSSRSAAITLTLRRGRSADSSATSADVAYGGRSGPGSSRRQFHSERRANAGTRARHGCPSSVPKVEVLHYAEQYHLVASVTAVGCTGEV